MPASPFPGFWPKASMMSRNVTGTLFCCSIPKMVPSLIPNGLTEFSAEIELDGHTVSVQPLSKDEVANVKGWGVFEISYRIRQEPAIGFCFEKTSLMLVSSGNMIFSSDNLLPSGEWKTIATVSVIAGSIRRFTYLSGRWLQLHRCRVLWTKVCLSCCRL